MTTASTQANVARDADVLFQPGALGALTLPNRLIMAPLTRNRAGPGNVPHDLNVEYYRQRASAGLIITEATQVSPEGVGYPNTPGIHDAAQIVGWWKVTDAVHAAGGRIFLQLWHVGRISHPSLQPGGALPVAPSAIRPEGKGVVATLASAAGETREEPFDRVILAVGITGNVEDLGLEGTAVRVEKGHIVVNEWLETGEPGVSAIGDVVGPPWLAHKASHEGVICVERIAGLNDVHPLNTRRIPGCTYCQPQVASVGLTEAAAKEKGHDIKVGRFPFVGNGKAIALGEPDGMIKTVFDNKTGELLGAHMIGAEVTELIQGYAVAMSLETTEAELMHTVFPHPTLSEMMHESVLDAYGRAIHF